MRLRLLARWWRRARPDAAGTGPPGWQGHPGAEPPGPGWARRPAASGPGSGRHRRAAAAAPPLTGHLARAEPAPWQQLRGGPLPQQPAPFGSPVTQELGRPPRAAGTGPGRPPRGTPAGDRGPAGDRSGARAAIRVAPGDGAAATARNAAAAPAQPAAGAARLPWYEVAHARRLAAGQRDCGPLERILSREWAAGEIPPPEVVRAIDRLAELPADVQERLAAGLDAIHVGPGGVPDLDHMMRLRGVPLPSGRASWDSCAGAYGERKIIVGTRPSSAPDVMCHEVGHALDDIDGPDGAWQSDSPEFRALYDRCLPLLVSDFHKQDGPLGRREFFADAFSAIASRQRPALVDMLGGHTRTALDVMLFFNVRYGI